MLPSEEGVPVDLPDQFDSALEALWQGDSSRLEILLDSDDVSAPLAGELLRNVFGARAVPVVPRLSEHDIPGYRIGEAIGRGGMGVVYRAWHEELRQDRAVKLMLMGPLACETSQERLRHEARVAARLRHPNIVRVLDSEELPSGQRYYVMDYVEGVDLSRYLCESEPEVPAILKLFLSLCDAVEHVHREGIVHRDLKPGNVIVDRQGTPHILDFGVAKAADYATSAETMNAYFSLPGEAAGTLPYLSPEQAAGKYDEVDERTDVHALGVMLYEALTRKRPYDATGPWPEALRRIVEDSPPPPSSISDRVDAGLERIILQALEKDKAQRYPSAAALQKAIDDYLRPEDKRGLMISRRMGFGLIAVVVLLGSGLLSGMIWWERQARADARQKVTWIQHYVEAGRTKRAFDEANSLWSANRGLPEAVLVLAQAGFARGVAVDDHDIEGEAIALLRARSEGDGPLWAYKALLSEMEGQSIGRSPEGVRAAVEAPDTAEAWYLLTYATRDIEAALFRAEQALERAPDEFLDRLIRMRLAHLYLLAGEYDDAAFAARRQIGMGGDEFKWRLFEIRVRITQGEYAEAIRLAEGLASRFPEYEAIRRHNALAHLCAGDYVGAGELYLRAWGNCVLSDWDLYKGALCQWLAGDAEAAAGSYRQFRNRRSGSFCASLRLYVLKRDEADFANEEGRIDDAEGARAEAGESLEEAGNLAKADEWRQRIVDCLGQKTEPQDLVDAAVNRMSVEELCEAYYYAGEVCRLQGRTEQAQAFFRDCVDTDLRFDPNSSFFDPMSEYYLARWRLAQ